ncbi:expressed unknown protein [Seminavis robusta]|uniref:Uncharacterized protein n=1 Tax=Seminavis robusta TaxID=568900 RepID=A0A9N8HH35_9STRA|nr:expressed unknown protein [Seminavis robusta]|eukprot:Sro428_g140950.1 n/a (189) ;mRNA; r:64173-64739
MYLLLLILLPSFLLSTVMAVKEKNTNVFGMELESCSTAGMAMTGITGTGHCVHFDYLRNGEISKTICIDVPSFSKAYWEDHNHHLRNGGNFFAATGQVASLHQDMPCTQDPTQNCPVQHWCINEDAFAQYVDYVGGCQKVGRILCQSTNKQAIELYQQEVYDGTSNEHEKNQQALECLRLKCWLPDKP